MHPAVSSLIVAEDETFPPEDRPRISVDRKAREVRFERWHHSNSFLAVGVQPWHVCRFDEIVSVSDFLSGDHRGTMLKGILAAGRLVPSHASAQELGSFFVSTRTGRCRFFSHWTNFEAVRQALRKIAPAGSRPPLTEDPRLLPVFVLAMLAAVAGIVWALL